MGKRLRRSGRWLWLQVKVPAVRFWRFVGRVGLALRRLLILFVWQPFLLLTTPFQFIGRRLLWPPLVAFWRLLGRMGLALRHLLTRFLWRPLRWLYRRTIRPFLRWIGRHLAALFRAGWQATAPWRQKRRRRWGSRWAVWQARWRVLLRRPRPPATAVYIPRLHRSNRRVRLLTVTVSIIVVLLISFVSLQNPQPDRAAAGSFLSRVTVATPTPAPNTPTPRPTIPVQLTPWATPDPLGGGGTLAFSQHVDGNTDIYLLPVGQAEPLRLTSHAAPDREPAWRPDGQALAFASHRDGNWELYVYDLPSGRLNRVTNDLAFAGHPSWSPDGQWLVYESYREQNLDVYVIKADGSEGPYRLTADEAADYAPVWSPGGRHIAFLSWRGGNPDLFLMSLDAVSDAMAVNVTNSPDRAESSPAFAPDGRYLSYSDDGAGVPLIYALPLNRETAVTGPPTSLGQQGRHPAWAPDSQSLVYVHRQNGGDYLIAGAPEGWGVAPQAFDAGGRLGQPSWTAVTLTPELADLVRQIEPAQAAKPLFVEALAKADTSTDDKTPSRLLYELPINAPSPFLSDQVDQSFQALRQRVIAEVGWDFLARLDNMFVPIDTQPLPGLPAQSWNKAGRAFDFYYREALGFEPQVEVVREDVGAETYWRVYLRAAAQDGSQGEPLRQLPWDFTARYGDEPLYYDEGGKPKDAIPAGYYVDFTALAADYGWERAPAAANWRTFFPAIRFWHFESRQGLSWEEAMREIYSEAELAALGEQ